MKRCPECRRDYSDESLSFCLDDGERLVDGPRTFEQTAILPHGRASESPTLEHVNATKDEKTTALRRGRLLLPVVLGVILIGSAFFAYRYWNRESGAPIDSIAVLPFQNRSTDADTEYLSSGLAESLIYRLSQLPELKVSPVSTVLRYQGTDIDPIKIGNELGVRAVLSGRIVQHGENMTISADLVDIKNNRLIWGEQYDRKITDLLSTQREIAREIVDKLKLKVTGDEKAIAKPYTESNEAYQLYLKGRFYWNKRTADSLKKAIEYFDQAIAIDPKFALAYAGLADCYIIPANPLPPKEAMPKGKAAAIRALELDDSLAEAHTALARVYLVYDWNWAEAEKEFKRAIELNPRYATARQWYGGYFEMMGRESESIEQRRIALESDPLSLPVNFELGVAYFYARDYDRAVEQFRRTSELDPQFPLVSQFLPVCLEQRGDRDGAIAAFKESIAAGHTQWSIPLAGALGHAYAVSGKKDEARKILEQMNQASTTEYVPADSFALVYAGLGENDEALAWLEKSYQEHAFKMAWIKVEPRWDSLRKDPRFQNLVDRLGFPR